MVIASTKTRSGRYVLDRLHDLLGGGVPLHVGRGEDVVALALREELPGGAQVQDPDAVQREPLRGRVLPELRLVGLEGDEERVLAAGHAASQEVEPERRLAGAGPATDQVRALRDEAAVEDLVQAGEARGASPGSCCQRVASSLECG